MTFSKFKIGSYVFHIILKFVKCGSCITTLFNIKSNAVIVAKVLQSNETSILKWQFMNSAVTNES